MVARSFNMRVIGVPQTTMRLEVDMLLAAEAQVAAVKAGAEEVEVLAKRYVRKDTHNLENSIAASEVPSRSRVFPKWRVTYAPEFYYGRMQELGTSKMEAHPFLRPASDTATLTSAFDAARRVLGRL